MIIPADNVKHLMLKQEVIDAVSAGRFQIHAVRHVYQTLALLTGMQPGEADSKGLFPAESVNGQAQAALKQLFENYQDTDEE